jgi:hypothetical protein
MEQSAIEGFSLTSTLFFVKPVTARVVAMSVEAKKAINVAPASAARHDDNDRETVSDTADATKCPGGSKASRP